MTWNPEGVVTIGGEDFTSESLWNVQINFGRTTIWDQARASYAVIQLLNINDIDFHIMMNDVVTVQIKNSAGTLKTVFTGKVVSLTNTLAGSGSVANVPIQEVKAIGVFAEMARKIIGDTSWSKEYDDDRMTRIFTDAGVTIDVVDTPPVYEFEARAADPADAYSLAAKYAQQAFGYIYETTDGKVGYANESHRLNYVQDYGYFDLDLSYIQSSGIQSNKTVSDILNSIILTYKANAQKTASDLASIATYGEIAGSVATELENGTEAQYQADRYITLRANPRTNLSAFAIQLDSTLLSDSDRNTLIEVFMGMAIRIAGLPTAIKNSTYSGFVEGWVLSFNRYQANLLMTTTDAAYSIPPTRWQDVDPATMWSMVGATITWATYDD